MHSLACIHIYIYIIHNVKILIVKSCGFQLENIDFLTLTLNKELGISFFFAFKTFLLKSVPSDLCLTFPT